MSGNTTSYQSTPAEPPVSGLHEQLSAAMAYGRALWRCVFLEADSHTRVDYRYRDRTQQNGPQQTVKFSSYTACLKPFFDNGSLDERTAERFRLTLAEKGWCVEYASEDVHGIGFSNLVFDPVSLARVLLSDYHCSDHELHYFAMRNIRHHYRCVLSDRTIHLFYLLASTLSILRNGPDDPNASLLPPSMRDKIAALQNQKLCPIGPYWAYTKAPELSGSRKTQGLLRPPLVETLEADGLTSEQAKDTVELFLECCRAVRHIRAHYYSGELKIDAETSDVEYLLSMTFGMPTGIGGLDELFGGGILLAENLPTSFEPAPQYVRNTPDRLTGRTVLITGRSGTGKTLLALKMAVEVARKGGLAWIMPLEQTAEDCLYAMEAMRALPNDDSIEIAIDRDHAIRLLTKPTPNVGGLIIQGTLTDDYPNFLNQFEENARVMVKYPLRLIIADPINSVERDNEMDDVELRSQTVMMFRRVKALGTNVLLVSEESHPGDPELSFEDKISDTVISLSASTWSVNAWDNYNQRFIEIRKSRLQREQRGEHPFSIVPGEGISVFPSPSAVMSRSRQPPSPSREDYIPFGLRPLDKVLGPNAIKPGDVIVLHGEEVGYKTPLGLRFLLSDERPFRAKKGGEYSQEEADEGNGAGSPKASDEPYVPRSVRRCSLMIAAKDDESTVRHMLVQAREQIFKDAVTDRRPRIKSIEDVRICSLPQGYVTAGYILYRIENEFHRAERLGYRIDRVMVDDVVHWDTNCPFLRNEETFGDTLVNLLQRQGVTSLFVCGDLSVQPATTLQHSIVHSASCEIQFDHFNFRGTRHALIRVLKTKNMGHVKESFELTVDARGIRILPGSSRMRIDEYGNARPVNVELFLHEETEMQSSYNRALLEEIRAVTSRQSRLLPRDRYYMTALTALTALGTTSAIEALQVLQLDEFQLPDIMSTGRKGFPLYLFEDSREHNLLIEPCVRNIDQRVQTDTGAFFAVPYYYNSGFLSYRRDALPGLADDADFTWQKLAQWCGEWEAAHPAEEASVSRLFFDFPRSSPENHNCLFFEILLSFPNVLEDLRDRIEAARKASGQNDPWCLLEQSDAMEAALLFRRLCRRAYLRKPRNQWAPGKRHHVDSRAVVWRHWYTTLNQMLSKMTDSDRARIVVTLLPGDVLVSGEWYLGIPIYSAAPDVGIEIIRLMTSHEAELERLRTGVGLPVRRKFYEEQGRTSGEREKEANPDLVSGLISPYFEMRRKDLARLADGVRTFSRSELPNYTAISRVLARSLQRILEFDAPAGDESGERSQIRSIFADLQVELEYVS